MAWGTLTLGRVSFREDYVADYRVNMNTGEQTIALSGVEYAAGLVTAAVVSARRDALMSAQGTIVPVTFSLKNEHDAFYEVVDVGVRHVKWPEANHFTWTIGLRKVGVANAIDIESRLTGLTRLNAFGLTAQRWHAPAIGATGYHTGSTSPGSVTTRTGADGAVTVYRVIPAGVDPRWAITAAAYAGGRVRVLVDGIERAGISFPTTGMTSWELSNGLVRVTPLSSSGLLQISAHDGTQWETKNWNLSVGSNLTSFDAMTVLRNDFEAVTIRLFKAQSPNGRILVDLTLRRGSRFVEGYVQASTSNTIGIATNTTETTVNNSGSGYIVASANDAAGNRLVAGSAQSFTGSTTGAMSKASTRTLDFFVGVAVGGGSAVAGDTATDLRDQYIGALAESTMVVKR